MLNVTKIIPQKTQISQAPRWLNLLYTRGLTDAAIQRAGIQPHGHGWQYAIHPDISAQRVKAFPGQKGPKYQWKPGKPDNARFYDPQGDLAGHIAAAGGVLILAAGEPDVWACWSAGIYNVTCTLQGEGTIPGWLITELHALKVRTVQVWPDCDKAGTRHAAKLRAALVESGIKLEIYALPFEMGSKGDLNTLLIEVGVEQFRAALDNCDPLILPESQKREKPRRADPLPDYTDLHTRYCAEIEQAAIRRLDISPPNGKGFSRQKIRCLFHDDHDPSANWNYNTHGLHCHVCGQTYSAEAVADALNLITWDDFRRDKTTAGESAAPDLRTVLPHTIGRRLIEAGLHNAALVLSNGGQQNNLTRRTFDGGLDQIVKTIQIGFVHFETHIQEGEIYTFQNVQNPPTGGRPKRVLSLLPPDQVLDRLERFFLGRSRAVRYQDAPSDVQPDFGQAAASDPPLSGAGCAVLDETRAGVYESYEEERQSAEAERGRDAEYIRQDFARICQGKYRPYDMPVGVRSAAELRKVLYQRELENHPEGIESYKLRKAAGVSRATQSRYRKTFDTVMIPQYHETPVATPDDIQLGPKQTAELVAPDGRNTLFLAGRAAGQDEGAQRFLAQYPGAVLRKSKPSIEKRREQANQAELDAYTRYAAEQRRRAKGNGGHPPGAKNVLLPSGYHTAWLEKQFNWTPGAERIPQYDAETGEVFSITERWRLLSAQVRDRHEQTTVTDAEKARSDGGVAEQPGKNARGVVRSGALAAGQPEKVSSAGWDDLSGQTRLAGDSETSQGEVLISGHQPAADRPAMPLWKLTGISEADARAHPCECCGQPAAAQNFIGQWRCEAHWAKQTAAAREQGSPGSG